MSGNRAVPITNHEVLTECKFSEGGDKNAAIFETGR